MENEKDPLMLWRIYGYRNIHTNKWYVGCTSRALAIRAGNNGIHYIYHVPKFAEAIRQYGWDSFEQNILRLCETKAEAKYWEEYYCRSLNSVENGYNINYGPKSVVSEELKENLSQIMKGLIPKKDGTYVDTGYDCRTDPKWIEHQNPEIALSQSKAVKMLDKETKEVIKVFKSKSEACRYLAPDKPRHTWSSMSSHIGRCLKGIKTSAYGYDWELV